MWKKIKCSEHIRYYEVIKSISDSYIVCEHPGLKSALNILLKESLKWDLYKWDYILNLTQEYSHIKHSTNFNWKIDLKL